VSINKDAYLDIKTELEGKAVLVAVSKTKPSEDILALYAEGQRDFGENYVQELVDKQPRLPSDIRWHFIGHLQSNKVKYIIPFIHLIQGVDSLSLLKEINKQAAKAGRVVDVLLQVYIAREETKFGLDAAELAELVQNVQEAPAEWANVRLRGLMGMASFSNNPDSIRSEFRSLNRLFDTYFGSSAQAAFGSSAQAASLPAPFDLSAAPAILSMGMSGDYQLAVAEGSTMVRIGSLLFGKRG
jgi:pyridoxal phosphate enzyme (YggS family)